MSSNTTTNETLSLPLLLRKESIKAERDDGCVRQQLIGLAMTCLLSFLLHLQFSISIITDPQVQNLIPMIAVHISVFLFFITSSIYRQTVQEVRIESAILHLMPELIALVSILLAYYNHAVWGFAILLVGKLCMAGVSVVYCVVQLLQADNKTVDDATDLV